MKRMNGILGGSSAGLSGRGAVCWKSDCKQTNKIRSKIVMSICLACLVLLSVNTTLVGAERAGSDHAEVADPTDIHPCTALAAQQQYVDYLEGRRSSQLVEEREALYRARVEAYDQLMHWLGQVTGSSSVLVFCGRLDDPPPGQDERIPYPRAADYDYITGQLQECIDSWRNGTDELGEVIANDLEFYLNRIRQTYEDYQAARLAYDKKENELQRFVGQLTTARIRLRLLEAECNHARMQSPPLSEILGDMEDPAGSGERKARLNGEHVTPAQTQKPQSGQGQAAMPETDTNSAQSSPLLATPMVPSNLLIPVSPETGNQQGSLTATPAQAQTQSSPLLTGQTMKVRQPATTTNTGTTGVGYTHMQVPRNIGQSGATVAPQKTPRSTPPIRQMRVLPQGSIKR